MAGARSRKRPGCSGFLVSVRLLSVSKLPVLPTPAAQPGMSEGLWGVALTRYGCLSFQEYVRAYMEAVRKRQLEVSALRGTDRGVRPCPHRGCKDPHLRNTSQSSLLVGPSPPPPLLSLPLPLPLLPAPPPSLSFSCCSRGIGEDCCHALGGLRHRYCGTGLEVSSASCARCHGRWKTNQTRSVSRRNRVWHRAA